jgi:hypothetical protein
MTNGCWLRTPNPDRLYRTPKLQEWRYPKSND